MSIYKRGRVYWVHLTVAGGPTIRESANTRDKTAAQEYHDRRLAELWRTRKLGERPRVAFADAAADWLEGHASGKKTFEGDKVRLATMLPHLPTWLDELTTARMTEVRNKLRADRALTASTCNKYLSILSGIWRYAYEQERVEAVPYIPTLKGRKERTRRRFQALTLEQAARLLAELPDHLAAMARFSLATGLRDANVRGLRWENVDLARRLVLVHGDEAKAGDDIVVPLSDDAVEVLQSQLGKHATHVFTFAVFDKQGKQLRRQPIGKRSNNTAWRKARARAGLPTLRWHDLRHTWATWHAQGGTPGLTLQALGGWRDGRMVRHYTHLAGHDLLSHANAIRVPQIVRTNRTNFAQLAPETIPEETQTIDLTGVADGIRTHNNWNHNPGLYR